MRKKTPPPPTLQIPRAQLQLFRSKALATKNECLAFLIGTIVKENDVITQVNVEELYYPQVVAGEDYVEWRPNDIVRLQAQILPRSIVGTLHSHPDYEPHISKQDIVASEQFGDVVCGIFSYWRPSGKRRRLTSLDWYYHFKMLECKII